MRARNAEPRAKSKAERFYASGACRPRWAKMRWVFSGEAVTQENLGRSPISANLNFWDDCLARRGRRTQPGVLTTVLTPGAQSIKGLALKGPKV